MAAKETSTAVQKQPKGKNSVLLGGIVLSVILWIIGITAAFQSYNEVTKNARINLENLGTRLAHHTSISLRNIDLALIRTVSRFAKSWDELSTSPIKRHDFLNTVFSGLHQLDDVMILDVEGHIIHKHRFDYGQADISPDDDKNVRDLLNADKEIFIGALHTGDSIGLSRPIYNFNGKLKGYVVAKIRKSYIHNIYEIGLIKDQHQFAIYSPNGLVLSIPRNATISGKPSLGFNKSETQKTYRENNAGTELLATDTQVSNYNLIIRATISFDKVITHWRANTVIFGAIAFAFSIFILVIAYQIQRNWERLQQEILNRREAENSLKKLSRAVEQSPASVIITDKNANIEYVNPKFTETTGYQPEEVVGQNPRMLSAKIDPMPDYNTMWATLLSGNEWRGQFCNRRKDGSIFWESASLSAIKNSKGEITHFLAVKEDITLRKQSEDQLQLAAAVFEAASEAIMVCDSNNTIETVNSSFTDITGYSIHEVIGKQPSLLKSGRHDDSFFREMNNTLLKTGRWEGEIWNRRKNGEIYPQWLSIKTIQDDNGSPLRYISLFSDITNRKQNEERILYQANYDALTGLPNRSLFMDRLQRAVIRADRSKTKIALLFIDLDRFKHVNDTLGHAYGDLLLQEASNRLTSTVRKSDTVARLGGDEFTVIIQDLTDFYVIENLVEKLLEQLSAPYNLENNMAFVSASIGITIFPNDGNNVEELLKNADAAMYQAKDNGRNLSQFFTLEMNDQANERRALETALHQALEREEFVLHYQPIVDAQTGMLVSCEALLRWHQPEHGNVFPDKFIPLAEDTGLILPIGEWVLEQACREALIWAKRNDTPPNVSVNLSSRQFQRSNMVELIKNTLEKTKLPAERLTLEITESLLVGDDKSIMQQLNGIRDLGCGLSIDDFGTGYSSLSYLRRFPITTLKIDRAFILDLPNDSEASALVSAILSMAKSLNLKVVAEGVESKEQLTYLSESGCEYIQGYHFSPPVPIEAFRIMAQKQGPLEADE